MIISKGIEIIPKRDKVTIASNIMGKWEDYSIDTYEGKVLKEAAERFKIMIKARQSLDTEVSSLKQMLTQQPTTVTQEMKRIDFWENPLVEYVEVPAAEATALEVLEQLEQQTTEPDVAEEPLQDVVEYVDDGEGPKCIIHAYINKSTGRQMYLSGWDNNLDWMISAVPYACSRAKCEKLIKKAEKQIAAINAEQKIRRRFPADLSFEIVKCPDSSSEMLTYNDIVRIANEMIHSHREAKRR